MTQLEAITKMVEERVAEKLPSILLERMIHHHAKHEWARCDCTFCALKREATVVIANVGRRWAGIGYSRIEVAQDEIWLERRRIRMLYRKRLRAEKEG